MGISSALGSSALLPAGLGFRNLLINGEFRINQRAYASAANLASGSYGFDRWKSTFTNTTLTFTSAPQGQMVTINSGGSIEQVIERENVSAGTYVLSWTGTATGRVYNTGATPPSFASSPIVVTLDGLANVEVEFTASGATKTLWKPQLEQNRQPTPFEQRPIGVELALCQRYYQRWQPYSYQYQSIGYTSGQGVGSAPSALPLSAYPRTFTTANVSLTFSSASHFECIANTGLATTATDISLNGLSPSAMSIRISGTFTTNVPYEFRFNNTSAFLALSMEL
jgi:hypothetical protein